MFPPRFFLLIFSSHPFQPFMKSRNLFAISVNLSFTVFLILLYVVSLYTLFQFFNDIFFLPILIFCELQITLTIL